MRDDAADLGALLRPTVESMGYEMLGVELQRRGKSTRVRVFIDSSRGIDLTDCERVSNQLSGVLDVEDPIAGNYTLEISSPGLDRPLFEPAHYRRFTGARVRVKLVRKQDGHRNYTGRIKQVTDDSVILSMDNTEYSLAFENIRSARIVPEYDDEA